MLHYITLILNTSCTLHVPRKHILFLYMQLTSGVPMEPSQALDPVIVVQVHGNILMVVECSSRHVL